jgi:hypothetical protein
MVARGGEEVYYMKCCGERNTTVEAVSFDKAEASDTVSVRDPSIVQIDIEDEARKE